MTTLSSNRPSNKGMEPTPYSLRSCVASASGCGSCPAFGFAGKKQVGMRPKETTMWYSAVGCVVTLTLSLLAAPLAADAQPPAKVARIVCLSVTIGPGSAQAEAFRQGLRELGYVEGHNIALEFRTAGETDRLPALAAELVQLPVDVIVALSSQAAQAVKNTTTKVPIVIVAGDFVALGLVASLAHPGGNLTGVTGMATELGGKRLELLREAVPSLARVAVLWNARDAAMTLTSTEIRAAARALGVTVQPLGVQEAKEIDSAIAAMTEERPDALFMIIDVLTRRHMKQVVDFAAQRQL